MQDVCLLFLTYCCYYLYLFKPFVLSILKGKVRLHEHKIVEHTRNLLKSLYQAGRENIWKYMWLQIVMK